MRKKRLAAPPSDTSSDNTQATIKHLLKSSILLVTNLTASVDQFKHNFDFIKKILYGFGKNGRRQAKAGWLKLESALKFFWHNLKATWLKIAPVIQNELALELEGGHMEWAEDAEKTWKKQKMSLKSHGKNMFVLRKRAKSD